MIQPSASDEVESRVQQPGVVIIDFYQASCPPCRVLEPRLAPWRRNTAVAYKCTV